VIDSFSKFTFQDRLISMMCRVFQIYNYIILHGPTTFDKSFGIKIGRSWIISIGASDLVPW